MNAPQSVTERYVSNLLHYGRNKEFDLNKVCKLGMLHDGTVVGYYFEVLVSQHDVEHRAFGATPNQALRRCLEKHGVTFR